MTARIRQARSSDLAALWPLAQQLDSYNLPADRRWLAHLLDISVQSFRGRVPRARAKYLFVMEARPGGRLIGCSLILAKHGTPRLPHLWLDVKTMRHQRVTQTVLQLGATTDGPTEIGGLIVARPYRGHPQHFGRQLSFVRFAYMARHPERFESRLLVEYLPPLSRTGGSGLWRAFGARFTGLSYHQADRLSMTDKTFILRSFPRTPIHASLFPPEVQAQIGQVHPAAAGACAMLRRVGFRYLRQVEPFDGGPYYGARRTGISVIRRTRAGQLRLARMEALPRASALRVGGFPAGSLGLICVEPTPGEFRAVQAPYHWRGQEIEVTAMVMKQLDSCSGMDSYVTPLAR